MEEQGDTDYVYRGGATGNGEGRGVRTVEVDRSVTLIDCSAFSWWHELRCIRIPDTVTRIGNRAFDGCESLTDITLPASLTSIDSNAFAYCTSLTSVTLPASLTTIDSGAFYNCTSLTDVTLPASLTTIHNQAFCDCASLISVKLPASLTSIHSGAFRDCTSLVSVSLESALTSIHTTSTFTNTTIDKSPGWFTTLLVEAGFSSEKPNNVLNGRKTHRYIEGDCMYYEWKQWARTIGVDGQLPLFTAVNKSLKWYYTKQIFTANMQIINKIDARSGLPLFLLAAAGPTSDIESVYNLLKEFPGMLSLNDSQLSRSKKRKWGGV